MAVGNDVRWARGAPVDTSAVKWLAVLRVVIGLVFLWAFFDKLFGLGYATRPQAAWLNGGSPTKGFLSHVKAGPFESLSHTIAGAWWADWLFMIGLAGIGIAVTLGVGLWVSAVSGTVMLLLMWAAEWPPAQLTSAGTPTGSTNPLLDYHVVYALVLIVLAATHAGDAWGLGRWWGELGAVRRNRWLR
ncbi:hypothetical protein [Allokutzneria oryzae]|uniref:DoxX family membrane protein n=1 Tax=Allokutzneria oryzae TaxID=1378989 RepID=A0ABV6A3A3_9PSEU